MTYLSELSQGRDNNLNLIRALAATAVLVSHAWPIALGAGTVEPLKLAVGQSMGTLSVAIFFVVSGFLIAMSFERSRTRSRFVVARALRLFPGLLVSLLLVALVMGAAVTVRPLPDYLADPGVWSFLARNMALVQPQYTLPGVFETNPYPTVEGSIWTLVHEVGCYVGVFVLGVAGLLARREAMAVVLGLYALLWAALLLWEPALHPKIAAFWGLTLPFAIGTALYRWQERVPLSLWGVAGLVGLAFLLRETALYRFAMTAALAYATIWLAYVPGGVLRAYNRIGDYSYGIYIYAFPLQGLAVWLWGPMSPWENIALSLPLTLLLAILSWHLVEKPALEARGRIVAWLHPDVARPSEVLADKRV